MNSHWQNSLLRLGEHCIRIHFDDDLGCCSMQKIYEVLQKFRTHSAWERPRIRRIAFYMSSRAILLVIEFKEIQKPQCMNSIDAQESRVHIWVCTAESVGSELGQSILYRRFKGLWVLYLEYLPLKFTHNSVLMHHFVVHILLWFGGAPHYLN